MERGVVRVLILEGKSRKGSVLYSLPKPVPGITKVYTFFISIHFPASYLHLQNLCLAKSPRSERNAPSQVTTFTVITSLHWTALYTKLLHDSLLDSSSSTLPFPSSRTKNGRSHEISTSHPPLRNRSPLPDQEIHPLHTSPHEPNTHQPSLNTSISLGSRRNTMGRRDTSSTQATVMVQVRESAESGGVQGAGCFLCLNEVDGGGGMGGRWWER